MTSSQFFIYLLKHLKGISNLGILKIISQCELAAWQKLTVTELIQVGQIQKRYQALFRESYLAVRDHTDSLYRLYNAGGFLTILDDAYPTNLRETYNAPAAMFYRGDLRLLEGRSLAIVGARAASSYGKEVVSQLMPELVANKMTIVSGLAQGIDTFSHQQAIRHGGKTIAVIGTSLERAYPKENQRLQEYLARHHLVLSEYVSGSAPLPYHFPARNRIIAGLTRGTCIIEAKEKSGSLITAQLALENGREVFAVPGSVLTEQAKGCHRLIQEGAKCVTTAQDILAEYQY